MIKKGFSYVEILISIAALAILTLSMAEFSSNTFSVMFRHGQQLEMADQTRFSSDMITSIINKADYIFPAGKTIGITGTNVQVSSINTTNAVAVLISDGQTLPQYYLKIFYFVSSSSGLKDLYQFSSSSTFNWNANTCPSVSAAQGTASLIASDIDSAQTTLTYLLNYNNGTTDPVLRGSVTGVAVDNNYALIKGINWNLSFSKAKVQTMQIEGISNNVPRFL
jgi:hypothetical protein